MDFDRTLLGRARGALFLLWNYLFRRMDAGRGMMQIGKSKAKVYIGKKTGVTFDDVEGIDEAEEELMEVVEFLKNPAKIPKAGGPHTQGRAARRTAGNRQNAAGPRLCPGKRESRFSAFQVRTSWRCLSALAPRESGIYLPKPRGMHRVSSLSTSLTRWVKPGE
jgi:hypothetical protein